jgi:predicted glycosyltransferase
MNENLAIKIKSPRPCVTSSRQARNPRVLLYSHDSYGLGHLRRNLAIARALLKRVPNVSVVILTGSPCATQFQLPPNCDVVKIPAVSKDDLGRYVPRGLDVSLDEAIALRKRLICATYDTFDPDVILVDHQPTGLLNEMAPVLEQARDDGKFLAFGARDIVDSPETVERAWSSRECLRAFDCYYDHVFIYGDRRVFDPLIEYPVLGRILRKVSVTGYVIDTPIGTAKMASRTGPPLVLVTVGGGDDGMQRISHYIDAIRSGPTPWKSHIVTGPLMPSSRVREYKHEVKHSDLRDRVKISSFHGDIPGLMRRADAVVSMAGYNSCLEILQSGTPGILMPREQMRQEQSIRAARLAALGLAQHVPMGDAARLRQAIEHALSSHPKPLLELNMDGLDNICDVLAGALEPCASSTRSATNPSLLMQPG